MLPDYSKGKIYKLVSNKTNDVYIGSCLMTLSTRLSGHRSKSNQTSSKKLFIDDAIITIALIEPYPCNSKNELKARELFHIMNTPCINANKPFVSELTHGKEWAKEYKIAYKEQRKLNDELNKEHLKEQNKIYYESNKEQINEQGRLFYESNKERILEEKKLFYESNKEQIKEQNKIYKEANKEKLNARRRELRKEKKALKATIQTA